MGLDFGGGPLTHFMTLKCFAAGDLGLRSKVPFVSEIQRLYKNGSG